MTTDPAQLRAQAEAEGWACWIRSKADEIAVANGCWFDQTAADRFIQFCRRYLRFTKDERKGEPFELLDWQASEVFAPILGWKRPDGKRRIQRAYISTAKKSGKSTILGALAIYLLLTEGPRTEIYSAAVSREQASIIFAEAHAMVKASKGLSQIIRPKPSTKTLVHGDSFYRALSSDAGSKEGLDASIVMVDELHAWKNRELFDALAYAGSARPQPLQLIITTAGDDLTSVWGEEYTRAKRWLTGEYEDESYCAVVYEAEPDDDWTDPATWAKANPSLGVTVPLAQVQRECREAIEIPGKQPAFKRYRCNLLVSMDATWLDMTAWDQCPATIDPAALAGKPCWGGLDLSAVSDLTAIVLAFDLPEGQVGLLPRFWLPRENIDELARQHKVAYRAWMDKGWLHTTDGNAVDYDKVVEDIKALAGQYQIKQIGLDRLFQGAAVEAKLMQLGFDVVPVGQGWVSQSLPAKELEKLILSRKLNHGGHPVLRWHASNVVAKRDDADNVSISKKRSREKIDGIAATLMALLCRMRSPAANPIPYMARFPTCVTLP